MPGGPGPSLPDARVADLAVLGLVERRGGRLAATIKESVCAGTLSFLAKEARKPGSYFWPRGGKRAKRLADLSVQP